jgi:uncharacterized protein YeaC (DUF1315 family)
MALEGWTGEDEVESFKPDVHRDGVQAAVAGMWPAARKLMANSRDRAVQTLLEALRSWDLRVRADRQRYPAAAALSSASLLTDRRAGLGRAWGAERAASPLGSGCWPSGSPAAKARFRTQRCATTSRPG